MEKSAADTRTKINDCGLSAIIMHALTCAITFCSKICVNCLRLDYNDRLTNKNILVPQSLSNDRNDTKTTPQQHNNKVENLSGKLGYVLIRGRFRIYKHQGNMKNICSFTKFVISGNIDIRLNIPFIYINTLVTAPFANPMYTKCSDKFDTG